MSVKDNLLLGSGGLDPAIEPLPRTWRAVASTGGVAIGRRAADAHPRPGPGRQAQGCSSSTRSPWVSPRQSSNDSLALCVQAADEDWGGHSSRRAAGATSVEVRRPVVPTSSRRGCGVGRLQYGSPFARRPSTSATLKRVRGRGVDRRVGVLPFRACWASASAPSTPWSLRDRVSSIEAPEWSIWPRAPSSWWAATCTTSCACTPTCPESWRSSARWPAGPVSEFSSNSLSCAPCATRHPSSASSRRLACSSRSKPLRSSATAFRPSAYRALCPPGP